MELHGDTKKIRALGYLKEGFLAPFRALKLVLQNRGLKRYFIIPFILNIILLSSVLFLAYSYLYPFLTGLLPQGAEWYFRALRWIMGPLIILVMVILSLLSYSITGSIIISPFNDILSFRVETLLTGNTFEEKFSLREMFRDILRITLNIIKLLVLITLFNILILVLHFIPLIGGALYYLLSFMATLFFIGFQFFDFPLERRRLVFRQKLRMLLGYKLMTIGLGLGFFILSFVPLLGFLGLNLGAVGATTLFIDHMRSRLPL